MYFTIRHRPTVSYLPFYTNSMLEIYMRCKYRLSVYNISLNRNKKFVNLLISEVETLLGVKIFGIYSEDVGNCFRTPTYEMQRAHWAILVEMKRIEREE